MKKIIKNNLRFLLLIGAVSLFSSAYAQDNLTVKWGSGSTFTDINTLSPLNTVNWDIASGIRQIQVTADFTNLGATGARTLTIRIPRGFKIQAYTAKKGTAVINGVSQIGLLDTEDAKMISSSLKALDGVTDFAAQQITGYTGANTSNNVIYNNMDGMITYSFTNQCDNITLTITLALETRFFPYNAISTTLPADISFTLLNEANSNNMIGNHLTVTATSLVVPSLPSPSTGVIDNGYTRQVAGVVDGSDPNKGAVPAFMTGIVYSDYSNAFQSMIHYAENVTFTTSYPQGVTYQGFDVGVISGNARWFTVNYTAAPAGGAGAYANGHLNVTVDAVNHKVTYTFTNVLIPSAIGTYSLIRSYWTADVDDYFIRWNQQMLFQTNLAETAGLLVNNSQPLPTVPSNTVIVTPVTPKISMTLAPKKFTMRDLNAYAISATGAEFPYDYAIGNIGLNNAGPTPPENITYNFTFSDSPQIRGVNLPSGVAADGTNIIATGATNLGNTINYNGTPYSSGTSFPLTPQMLGLQNGEYLTSLSVKQNSLAIMNYNNNFTYSSIGYYGKWINNGKIGPVKLSITDEEGNVLASAIDTTKVGWASSGAGSLTTTVVTPSGNPVNTFYPGQSIVCTSTYSQNNTSMLANQADIVDPDIYINLPAGISLNVSSLTVQSTAGRNRSSNFSLNFVTANTKVIDGVEWTSYHFNVKTPLDIIALSTNQNTASTDRTFVLKYTAIVSPACSAYAGLSASQICQIDLGQTAVTTTSTATSYVVADVNNWTTKGVTYNVVGATQSPNVSVVQQPGLQVYLGIKTAGPSGSYYTYNGTAASIAAVSRDVPAEVWLKYENTSNAQFYQGSEIYLPIPKKNIAYDHYFNNTNTDGPSIVESGQTANIAPQWTSELISEVNLSGFDTYYGIDTSPTTNYTSSAISVDWKPVTMTWYSSASALPAGKSLNDVTMLKFMANQNIASAGQNGSTGETTFQLSVAPDAELSQYDYWRSYQKGWRLSDGTGSWDYGSVIAASPGMSGVEGSFFKDGNVNGVLDASENYTGDMPVTAFTASLTGPGIATALMMNINSDGLFKSLNADNITTFYLREGTYTVTIINSRPDLYHFTTYYPDTRSAFDASTNPVWMNDIPPSLIRTDNTAATFTFTVTSQSTITQLVGIGLKGVPTHITVNPQVGGKVVFSE